MSACEECWTEAARRALMLGGSTPDRYREVCAEAAADPRVPWHLAAGVSSVQANPDQDTT